MQNLALKTPHFRGNLKGKWKFRAPIISFVGNLQCLSEKCNFLRHLYVNTWRHCLQQPLTDKHQDVLHFSSFSTFSISQNSLADQPASWEQMTTAERLT